MSSLPRVLITGASGFLGSHITETFLGAGYRVRCGLRRASSRRWLEHLEIEVSTFDLSDPETLRTSLRGVDVVVHAAGLTRARDPVEYRSVNVEGTERLTEAALGEDVRRFIYISSLAARGPDTRTSGTNGGDHPSSAYGESKLAAERMLRERSRDLDVVVLRPSAVYGPRDRDILMMFKLARAGFVPTPNGAGRLQSVFVTDVATAALAAATTSAGFGPFEVAEATAYSWPEVAEAFGRAFGRTVRPFPLPRALFTSTGRMVEELARLRGAVPEFDLRRARDLAIVSYTCSPGATTDALGWKAQIALPEGLARTAVWYLEHGWL